MNERMTKQAARHGAMVLVGLLLMTLGSGSALATPKLMSAYGDQLPWYSAEINAMGGTGTALYRGGLSNIYNPAFLVEEQGYRLDAGLSLDQAAEDRFVPLYDSFGSYGTDVAVAANRQHYWQTGFGLAVRLPEHVLPATVAVSLADRYPFGYKFTETLRNPYIHNTIDRDQILEDREYEVTGNLRDLSLGLGVDLDERFSAGVAVHYAFGTRKTVETVRDKYIEITDGDTSYRSENEFELSGVNYTLGLRGKLNERLEIGVAWETQLAATGDFSFRNYTAVDGALPDSTYEGFYRYPNMYRVGLAFRPRAELRTTFTAEVEYKPFEEMADSENPGYDNPQDLADVTDVRVGLEHIFPSGMPVRFGFRYIDAYGDAERSCSVFTAGLGMAVGNGMASASLELGKLTSRQDHIFGYPDEEPYSSAPTARVEDTRFRVGIGYTMNF